MDIIITVCAGIPEQVWSTIWDRSGVAENKNKKKNRCTIFLLFTENYQKQHKMMCTLTIRLEVLNAYLVPGTRDTNHV